MSYGRTRLAEKDRYLAVHRAPARSSQELAAELDEKPDALRRRLTRALDRVAPEYSLSAMR